MNQEKIGKFIAEARKGKNLTQQELADKLGLTYKAVSKWECGKGLPDVYCAIQVCEEGGISKDVILTNNKRGLKPSGDLIPWTSWGCFTSRIIWNV